MTQPRCFNLAFALITVVFLFAPNLYADQSSAPATLDKSTLQRLIAGFPEQTPLQLDCQCLTAKASGQILTTSSYSTVDEVYGVNALDEAIQECGAFQGKFAEVGYQQFEAVTSCGLVVTSHVSASSTRQPIRPVLPQNSLYPYDDALIDLFSRFASPESECTCAVSGTDLQNKPTTRFEKFNANFHHQNLDAAALECRSLQGATLTSEGQKKSLGNCGLRVVGIGTKIKENGPARGHRRCTREDLLTLHDDVSCFRGELDLASGYDYSRPAPTRYLFNRSQLNFGKQPVQTGWIPKSERPLKTASVAVTHKGGMKGEDPSDPANPSYDYDDSSSANDNADDDQATGDTGVDWHGKTGGF